MGNVHTKVAVVLRFIDAVTEQWVKSAGGRPDITVKVRQQNKVLWKAADCAVILAQPGVRSVDIAVSGADIWKTACVSACRRMMSHRFVICGCSLRQIIPLRRI